MVFLPDLQVLHDYHPKYENFRRKKFKAGYSLAISTSDTPNSAAAHLRRLICPQLHSAHLADLRAGEARLVLERFATGPAVNPSSAGGMLICEYGFMRDSCVSSAASRRRNRPRYAIH
jgi:hypothetical protein